MQDENLIPVHEICVHHHIELDFIQSLQDHGLIEIATAEESFYIPSSQLAELEKMIHLHYELDVNIEGIDVIRHLLKRLGETQAEVSRLKSALKFYGVAE